jgi:hypothetical protein
MLYRAKKNNDEGITKIPMVGKNPIFGYELVNTFFVDSSGFGQEGEMALTFSQFLSKVRQGYYYGIQEAGQFQVYIGEYRKTSRKAEFEAQGIVSSKKIKNNTRLTIYNNGDKTLTLHNTDIIKWIGDKIILNSGGWDTMTTRSRLNEFLPSPYRVFRRKGITYVSNGQYSDKETELQFFDGLELPRI